MEKRPLYSGLWLFKAKKLASYIYLFILQQWNLRFLANFPIFYIFFFRNFFRQLLQNNVPSSDPNKLLFPDMSVYRVRKEFEQVLMQMRQPDDKGNMDEQNFLEARQNLLKAMGKTKVRQILGLEIWNFTLFCQSILPPRKFPAPKKFFGLVLMGL